jgi:FdhD protein
MDPAMSERVRDLTVVRVKDGQSRVEPDCAAIEEPLEIRLHGRPFAVIMRTPGADRELTAGFLLAEGVLKSADDLGTIQYCADAEPAGNIVNVTLSNGSAGALDRLLAARRQVTTNSSCGMCGRQSIESLMVEAQTIGSGLSCEAAAIVALPDRLRAVQAAFDETGGLHAAGLFTSGGELVLTAEDVGRHNAVDKVIGAMLMREALPLSHHMLFVSGRTSFEIVQKAFIAGVPIVAAVSAPSSLAIDLAVQAGITLIGFVRGGGFNVYANPQRIKTRAAG